jgi:hypothetical protein
MKLYDLAGAEDDLRFSPNCWRIKMALEHKSLVCRNSSVAVRVKGCHCIFWTESGSDTRRR